MTVSADLNVVNPSLAINDLKEKRDALKKLIQITQAVGRLNMGLQATLLLGKPSSQISKRAIAAYETLSEKTRMLPAEQLKMRSARLDEMAHKTLGRILEIAAFDDNQLEQSLHVQQGKNEEQTQSLDEFLTQFRRNAQTAIAIRVLLRERGVFTPAVTWPFPEKEIKSRITLLKKKENTQRSKIKENIKTMQMDVQNILYNSNMPEELKNIAQRAQTDLGKNLNHLESGKSLDEMPITVEVIELSAVEDCEDIPQEYHPPAMDSGKTNKLQPIKNAHLGFVDKLKIWIDTPWSTSWKGIDSKSQEHLNKKK